MSGRFSLEGSEHGRQEGAVDAGPVDGEANGHDNGGGGAQDGGEGTA